MPLWRPVPAPHGAASGVSPSSSSTPAGCAARTDRRVTYPSWLFLSEIVCPEGKQPCVGQVLGGGATSNNHPFFRPDISRVGADRASVMRCRWSLLLASGCCCCCQPLVLFPISERGLPGVVTAPCPPQAPAPNPTAAEPDGRRVLSRVGVADHAVTPQAP